ncbi:MULTISPECIES: DMT family transporter [Dolichospermum]|jgi:drug/metabolite transporter (DMT)-like permease|uniref:DMT family transporter n=1 Tax=Dolichospermum heterosporum TAC447 TaxID=747523 RepID=A0ABY5LUU7_9CYAN|nr:MULTISPECIES: DMT family transporter [Dolichospermum]MBE9258906.1 DMT family transporter [Dolichospermum sp. LEGE 00246]UUO15065.1 DMT family transporter [Dolichospermum heterosporum TAC447]
MTIELNNYSQKSPNTLYYSGIAVLLLVTLIWGTSYPVLKAALGSLSPSVIFATRFAVAALPFTPYLRFVNLPLLRDGILLGLIIFSTLTLQTVALETTSANHAAFIASFNVILVPLLGQLLGRQVLLKTFLAAAMAIFGVGVMCWESEQIVVGDFLMLGNAFLYSIYILKLESITLRHPILPLTAIQLWVIAIVSLIWGAPDLVRQYESIGANWAVILYLGLFDTAATILLQVLAQKWVNAYETALMYTLEPIFAAVFSFLLLGEKLGVRGIIGATFVLMAMIFGQTKSQDTEQDHEVQVNEPIVAALSSVDSEPINIPVSLLNSNLMESE